MIKNYQKIRCFLLHGHHILIIYFKDNYQLNALILCYYFIIKTYQYYKQMNLYVNNLLRKKIFPFYSLKLPRLVYQIFFFYKAKVSLDIFAKSITIQVTKQQENFLILFYLKKFIFPFPKLIYYLILINWFQNPNIFLSMF